MRRLLQRFTFVLLVAASTASAGTIGLYSDTSCSSCNLTIDASTGFDTLYVRISTSDLEGYEPGNKGLGLAFKIEGLPAGWFWHQLEGPNADFTLGSPFDPDGVLLWFNGYGGTHEPGLVDCFPLYTFVIGPTTVGAPAELRVVTGAPYSCFGYFPECPNFRYYRFELYCECASPGILYVNTPGDCTVAVQRSTWSQLKHLYE